MANEINIQLDPGSDSGLTVSAQVRAPDGTLADTVVLSEVGSTAYYTGDLGTVAAGSYLVAFLSGGALVGTGALFWDGSAEVDPRTLDADLPAAAPAAATVAAAVRTELASELGRVDVAVSTRSSHAAPAVPSAAANATAVRSELAAELADVTLSRKLLRNRVATNGDLRTVLDDDDSTTLVTFDVSSGRVPQ